MKRVLEKTYQNYPVIFAGSRKVWRKWLSENYDKTSSVWLVIFKKSSKIPSVYYPEAVDEALCFGWVDSKPNKRDEHSYYQFFSPRNPKSNWSLVNKKKVEALLASNLMEPPGLRMVELAKQTGTWDALDNVSNLIIEPDLIAAFEKNKVALENWESFSPSSQRGILEWIYGAKRPETRAKRIKETVALAAENKKANQFIKQ